jgi:hypothetical protein
MRHARPGLAALLCVLLVATWLSVGPALADAVPRLTGTVRDASGPVAFPVLDVYHLDQATGWTFGDEFTGTGDGTFSVPLSGFAEGEYTVKFSGDGDESLWLGGTSGIAEQLTDGNHFTVPSVSDVDLGTIVLTRILALHASGAVTGPSGARLGGLAVRIAADADALGRGEFLDSAWTSSAGAFTIGVPSAGSYAVQVDDPTHFLLPATAQVVVGEADATLDPVAVAANPSLVTGKLLAAGAGLADAAVTTLVWDGSAFIEYASASTDTAGLFAVPVPVGACFTVRYRKSGYATGYLGGGGAPTGCGGPSAPTSADPGAANPVADAVLTKNWAVTGTVASVQGSAAAFAGIDVYPSGQLGEAAGLVTTAWADGKGVFEIPLAAGDYELSFFGSDVPFSPTSRSIRVSAAMDLGTVTVQLSQALSGQIRSSAGPLERATASLFLGTDPVASATAVTGADGRFEFPVVAAGAAFTVRLSGHGFADDSVSGVMPAGPLGLDPRILGPAPSDLGAVAGQRLDYCTANRLPAGDETSSAAVTLPFAVQFFGKRHSSAYVNTNGSISFTAPRGSFLPAQLTAATGVPMIAPFLADIDASAAGDREVSYGPSPDGSAFCVQWADARQFGGAAHDTFQLLLTAVGTSGDFDLTFNYDRLTWDTGIFGTGSPATAVAGFSDGTGTAGGYLSFPGSGVAGALIDEGQDALVSGSLNSGHSGRYVIGFRAAETAGFGSLSGALARMDGSAAGGIQVTACRDVAGSRQCDLTTSRSDGSFSFLALRAGDYRLDLAGGDELDADPVDLAVVPGATTAAGTLRLRSAAPSPSASPSASPGTASPSTSPTAVSSQTPVSSPTPSVMPVPSPTAVPSPTPSASVTPPQPTVPAPPMKQLKPATPKISGTRRVGKTLKAHPGTWRPAHVKFSYQWLRSGKPIAKATKSSHRLTKADRGHRIRVRVTGRLAGYVTAATVSAATVKVKR